MDKSLIAKIKYQIKEGKFPVAYWAIEELLNYISQLEDTIKNSKEVEGTQPKNTEGDTSG